MADRSKPDLFSWKANAADERDVLTVSELTHRVKRDLETAFPSVWVAGEISNCSQPNSGHIYLTLKDKQAQLSGVIWRSTAQRLRFELHDGMAVLAQGGITVYPPRGNYQLIIRRIMPEGMGSLQLAFQQLKEKLEKEGLFAAEHKKPLPAFPRRIGIVTSPTGAAIRDILKQIRGRFPSVEVFLYPAYVQGEKAARSIAEGIRALNTFDGPIDVIIAGRGGGSIEDLWAFNEEPVARAIHASKVPVISAVGHEVDVTISDLVADARALTPTAAGEMVVPDRAELGRQLDHLQNRLRNSLRHKVHVARERLRSLEQSAALRKPLENIRLLQQQLDDDHARLQRVSEHWLSGLREKLGAMAGRLESLSPLKVLGRGYSLSLTEDGNVVRDANDLKEGETIKTIVSEGAFLSVVKDIVEHEYGRKTT